MTKVQVQWPGYSNELIFTFCLLDYNYVTLTSQESNDNVLCVLKSNFPFFPQCRLHSDTLRFL